MSEGSTGMSLPEALARTGLFFRELWVRYLALGGSASTLALEAYVHGALDLPPIVHDMIAHVFNEEFAERGRDHPVGYRSER
jgi:hypothetical protein